VFNLKKIWQKLQHRRIEAELYEKALLQAWNEAQALSDKFRERFVVTSDPSEGADSVKIHRSRWVINGSTLRDRLTCFKKDFIVFYPKGVCPHEPVNWISFERLSGFVNWFFRTYHYKSTKAVNCRLEAPKKTPWAKVRVEDYDPVNRAFRMRNLATNSFSEISISEGDYEQKNSLFIQSNGVIEAEFKILDE
jgi:hypothetical protein